MINILKLLNKSYITSQFNQIEERGWTAIKHKAIKLFKIPIHIIGIVVALPLVVFVRFIKPFIHIRFRKIISSELGHFVDDAGILLCESVLNKSNIKDWYWLTKPISNYQFEKMVKRTFYVRLWVKYLYIANNIIPGGKQHTMLTPRETQGSRDIKGLLYKTKKLKQAYFKFSIEEELYAKKYLKDIGLNEKDKFVCLLVRDYKYKETISPYNNWEYHNYRNSDIDTYALAATALAEKNYWVFRMGKFVAKPFNCNHPKVIDYSTSGKNNDLLDIWLMANCLFCITTGTGLDSVSLIFRKPLLFINFLPMREIVTYFQTLTHFKHLRWRDKNKELNFKECLDNSWLCDAKYKSKGIDVVDLSANEIKNTVLEMEARVMGNWLDSTEDRILQDRFWHMLKKWKKFKIYHSFVHHETSVSSLFLRSQSEFCMSEKL